MPTLRPGNRPSGRRSARHESGSILIDAIVGTLVVAVLGVGLVALLAQVFGSLTTLSQDLHTNLESLSKAYTALWQ